MEKKLTDEEIVKAARNCLNGDYKTKCKGCYYDKAKGYCQDMDRDLLDLIHRLQAKYRNLEINYNDVYEHYRELELENPKLKAEIERLTELQSRGAYRVAELGIENAELQKQVEYWESETKIARRDIDEAVKDTAKEIFDIVMSDECSVENTFDDTKFTKIIKERYGVEVEL